MTGSAVLPVDTPIGRIVLQSEGDAVVGLVLPDRAAGMEVPGHTGAPVLDVAARQLDEYFAGGRTCFDVPVRLRGTDFQRAVWAALCRIPYGETISYGELARRVGSPGGSRAVGQANGRNPVAIIVPCHRVVAGDGIGGYGGGLPAKRALLALEGFVA